MCRGYFAPRCANSALGLPRTRADMRKAVALALGDAHESHRPEHRQGCRIDHKIVSKLRRAHLMEFTR